MSRYMGKHFLFLSIVLPCIPVFGQMKLGDLNGDDRADLLFRQADASFACSFDTTQRELLSNRLMTGFEKDETWHVAVLAHLDTDGKSDLLLRHPNGMWEYVPMDGCTPREADRTVISSLADTHWRIVLAADMDDDGRDELFWRNVEGQWTIRYMDGAKVRQTVHDPTGLPPNADWYVVGTGDLDADGVADLVIRHRDGSWQRVWPTRAGENTFSSESVPFELDPRWRAEAVADFDGDGKDDLLLRHAKGHWKVQALATDESTEVDEWVVNSLPNSWDWRLEAFGDINGDGKDDLLTRGPQNQWRVTSVSDSAAETETIEIGRDPNELWRIPNPPVYIPDTILEQSIKTELNLSDKPWIFPSELRRLTQLSSDIQDGRTDLELITDLRGLRHASSLRSLNLSNQAIEDLSPLIGLDQLRTLSLNSNKIQNISPLSGFSALTSLRLSSNQLDTLEGIESLVDLDTLYLDNNELQDIAALSGLTKLITLDLGRNQVTNINALTELVSLSSLTLAVNEISNVTPLQALTQLRHLNLDRNHIESTSGIEKLTILTRLDLRGNRISDISGLVELTNLRMLDLASNRIGDIGSIRRLTKLTHLYLHTNQISDISPLEGLTELLVLRLNGNQVSEIRSLEGLTNLTNLYLHDNQISDISPLVRLTSLRVLNLASNRIEDIGSVSALTELTHLYLYANQISNISPLEGLTRLVVLNLNTNQVSEIRSLEGLTQLEQLLLRSNPLNEHAVSTLNVLSSRGVVIRAEITRSFTDSRGTSTKFAYDYKDSTSEPKGVLVFFHGNNAGTQSDMINLFLPFTRTLATRHGLIGIVVPSPEGRSATLPWSVPAGTGEGTRFYNYTEDIDFLHELLQSGFGGAINVDDSQVYLRGGSQGTCFLNRFVSKWGKHYGGGLLADCGCSEGLDPLLHIDPTDIDRFRVFVRATTDDFLHNLSRQAYGYFKYVVGFDTWGDLNSEGSHCSRSDVSDDEALKWLREGGPTDEAQDEAYVARVSLFDRIVGLATDMDGVLWIVQQLTRSSPQATIWRSVDRGVSFEYVSSLQHEIYDLDIVENRLFLTTPEGPILRSDDSGRTFLPINLNRFVANGLIALSSGNEAVGRVRTAETPVLVSTLGGSLLVLPRDPSEPRLYMSTNLGESWSERPAPHVNLRGIRPDPNNLHADEWNLTIGRPPSYLTQDDRFRWNRVSRPTDGERTYSLRSTAWNGTELLGLTAGYGSLWSSTDHGNRWDRKPIPKSAEISFGVFASADLTAISDGDVLLVGGGRDAQLYNGHGEAWEHIYGAAGIGLTPGYVQLPHKVAVDPIRGDIYITDSRGLFRIDARFRPNEVGVPAFDDRDDDGIPDSIDQFPEDSSEYLDTDSDGIGNNEDVDDDGDGTEDAIDASPLDPLETSDLDGDGVGDRHDNDQDGDRVADVFDQFPRDPNESLDSDHDGIGNWEDLDDDNDGINDLVDAFPLYPNESADSDGDFVGDNIDPDPNESTFASDDHLSPGISSWAGIRAISISMGSTKPSGLIAPAFTGGRSLFGALNLGNAGMTSRQLMLVIFETTETPLLYLDRNGDNDLTNDGPALHLIRNENRPRERWYESWVEVSYQAGITLPYYLYLSVGMSQSGESATLSVGASGRVLSKTLPDDKVMNFVVVDRNGDGLFNGTDDFFCVDINFDGRLPGCDSPDGEGSDSERFRIGESFALGGTTYTPHVTPSGYAIEFETETDANSSARASLHSHKESRQTTHRPTNRELTDITEDSFYEPFIAN